MATTVPNPYYNPAWGVAGSNIAQALFGNPDRAAAYDADVAQTDVLNQKAADLRHAATSRNALQQAILGFDPANPENTKLVPQLYSNALGAGDINDASALAKVMLGLNANMGGSDDQVIRSMAGTGQAIGKDDAVSLAGQDAIRSGNFAQDTAIKNSELANALLIGDRRNATDLTREQMQQSGLDRRMTVNAAPGATVFTAPGSPMGQPEFHGAPTPETVKGAVLSNFDGAGGFADPTEPMVPMSPIAVAMGATGGGSGPKLVTNSDGVRVEDGAGVNVGLPGGKPNTPHNYRQPDGKVVLSTDGLTNLSTKQPLPAGTVQVGTMPASPTEYQSKAVLYANAYTSAMDAITKLPPDFDPTNAVMHVMGDAKAPFTANSIAAKFQDPNQQRYMRAVAELAAVTLRGDSGAAINADEFSRYDKIYFPQIGEDKLVQGDKWRALNDRKQSYITAAGGFYELAQDRIAQNPVGDTWGSTSAVDISAAPDPDAAYDQLPSGARYKGPDGIERVKP